MTDTITVQMLVDVTLTVDADLRVAFDEHGQCYIVNEADGEIKYVAVDYVKPALAPVEEPTGEPSDEMPESTGAVAYSV